MATLKDLSRTLGLSVTQVSRALNGHGDVSEATRQRVLDAAKQLKYQPNLTARRLVTGRSGIVGLVLSSMPDKSNDRQYMQIVGGLSAQFARAGMQFMLHIAEGAENIIDVYRKLIDSGSLDGFVIMEPSIADPRIAFLQEREIPFVLHGRTVPNPDYPYFDIDNHGVAYRLTRHLIDAGHRRIAFANGEDEHTFAHDRLIGYRLALEESGIAFDPALHIGTRMTEAHGMSVAMRLFQDATNLPTAAICSSTLMAKGFYSGLEALGLSVPDDVSVVAHDDLLPEARPGGLEPGLTCTRAPLAESWRPLADFLVGAVNGAPLDQLQEIGEVDFVERDSVAPPRGSAGRVPPA